MAAFERILSNNSFTTMRVAVGATCAGMIMASASGAAAAEGTAPFWSWNGPAYNWSGFYAGGYLGVAAGSSNWTTPNGPSGSTNFFQPINSFDEGGSFFAGLQGGYNYLLPNRLLIGAEVDASFPSFQTLPTGVNPFGVSIGGTSNFTSPTPLGPVSFAETVLSEGTVRARLGYAPGHWLFYATGGFAWSYDQQSLTQIATGNTVTPFLWRLGWTAGAGVEVPIVPHWAARLEYLFKDYGASTTAFFGLQPIRSDLELHEVRLGLDYQFGGDPQQASPVLTKTPATFDPNNLSFHGQTTFVWQGYPAFRSAIPPGPNSFPSVAQARETFDATLFVGARLWQGAELWINPEIDQGHGLSDTHGAAGFPSGESYKLGFDYPYARVQRYFIRQTIDLGGETQKVEADVNQFAGSQTENRLVLTVGKFYVIDLFDTNKYANNPKNDFLNWSIINAGSFDFAGDAWSPTYGAAAEWYQGIFAFRAGVFDMSEVPAGGGMNAQGYELDPTFSQQQFVGEIEERHELWGEPGKLKITGFVIHGRMGDFQDAIALSQPGQPFAGDPSDALASVRIYRLRPGVSFNLEQQVNDMVGVFARVGWADGAVEPWDNTDIDRSVSAGVSISGKQWGRPNDTVGIAGVINGLDPVHAAYFAAGGTGIVIGDGALAYGLEQIVETYYSYALTSSTKISVDYQFIANPGYNTQRGPVNIFGGRFHTEF